MLVVGLLLCYICFLYYQINFIFPFTPSISLVYSIIFFHSSKSFLVFPAFTDSISMLLLANFAIVCISHSSSVSSLILVPLLSLFLSPFLFPFPAPFVFLFLFPFAFNFPFAVIFHFSLLVTFTFTSPFLFIFRFAFIFVIIFTLSFAIIFYFFHHFFVGFASTLYSLFSHF